MLLFAKAKVSQAKIIRDLLASFSAISGLKVSLAKSNVFASKGVLATKKEKIKMILGMNFTSRIDKYLGFKLFNGRVKEEDFHDVMGCRLLNKPGRLTLGTSVLSSIPSYGMQVHTVVPSIYMQSG